MYCVGMHLYELLAVIIYLMALIAVAVLSYKRQLTETDFIIGGRSLGSWLTAMAAQASDMSGWLLMGLPGLIYLGGMKELWVPMGLLLGTILNWRLIAARLRVYTEKTNSITLPCFFARSKLIM